MYNIGLDTLNASDKVVIIGSPVPCGPACDFEIHGPTSYVHHTSMMRVVTHGQQGSLYAIHRDTEGITENFPNLWNLNDTIVLHRGYVKQLKDDLAPKGEIKMFCLTLEHELSARYQKRVFWDLNLFQKFLEKGVRERIFHWSRVRQLQVIPGIYHLEGEVRYPIFFARSSAICVPNSVSHFTSLLERYHLWKDDWCVIPWQRSRFTFYTFFDAILDYDMNSVSLKHAVKLLDSHVADLPEIEKILVKHPFDCFLMFPIQNLNPHVKELAKKFSSVRRLLKDDVYGLTKGGFLDLEVDENADDMWKTKKYQASGERSGESSYSEEEDKEEVDEKLWLDEDSDSVDSSDEDSDRSSDEDSDREGRNGLGNQGNAEESDDEESDEDSDEERRNGERGNNNGNLRHVSDDEDEVVENDELGSSSGMS